MRANAPAVCADVHFKAGDDATPCSISIAAGRAQLKLLDERASANRSMNRTRRAWFAPATDPTSTASTPPLARNRERERPVLRTETATPDRDLRGFGGALRGPPKSPGFPKGHRLWGAPLVAPKA